MTLEDRLSRIENALINAGLIEPEPGPTREQAVKDALAGDFSSLKAFAIREFKKGNRNPLGPESKRGGKTSTKKGKGN